MANPIAVPGTVVASGNAVSPGGAQGVQGLNGNTGPAGPSAVSGNAGNQATLGTDSLIFVPLTAVGTLTTQYSITGGGSMRVNLTINLVGDVASPGNNYFYGTGGTGTRGWYALPTTAPPPTSLTDLGSPAGNSTINTAQASVIAVNLNWTTAANWTLTLQNVALGAQLYLRLLNSSGAARTFTITATNPSAASYTVTLYVPGSNPLTGAISVNNGNAINTHGVAYTVGGSPVIQLFGFGSTG